MDSQVLDAHWREALKDKRRFSLNWYRDHPITKELLKSDVLNGDVIEFGCGLGVRAFLARISRRPTKSVVGIDLSSFAIHMAHYWKAPGLRFIQDDLLDLDYVDNAFNNGYMLAVIEHIEDTGKLLSECKRVIKPGGKLFISVTENDYHGDQSHVHTFDQIELRATLIDNGFSVLESYVKDHIVYGTAQVC